MRATHSVSKKEQLPDASWRTLYLAGGFAALLYVIMIIVPLVLVFTFPQPPSAGGAAVLQFIASHKAGFLLAELVCFVGLSLPPAIRRTPRSSVSSRSSTRVSLRSVLFSGLFPNPGTGAEQQSPVAQRPAGLPEQSIRGGCKRATASGSFHRRGRVHCRPNARSPRRVIVTALERYRPSFAMLKGIFRRSAALLGTHGRHGRGLRRHCNP